VFRIDEVIREMDAAHVHFRSRPGKTYVVEWITGLTADWQPLPPVSATAASTFVTHAVHLDSAPYSTACSWNWDRPAIERPDDAHLASSFVQRLATSRLVPESIHPRSSKSSGSS